MKAEHSRLIPRNHTENPVLLTAHHCCSINTKLVYGITVWEWSKYYAIVVISVGIRMFSVALYQ